METKKMQEGWHEICGIKFYGKAFPPDLTHDAIKSPGRFRNSSYCQICMRRSDKCICHDQGLGEIKEGLNTIECLTSFVPIEGCDYKCTILGQCEERSLQGLIQRV